jgi:hypothetical protein
VILPGELYKWPAIWQELWNERVGIMQFEGGMSEKQAKYEAERDIRKLAINETGSNARASSSRA